MAAAVTGSPAKTIEIGLVLQGGGALGAYEYGGIIALFDLMDESARRGRPITFKVVTGVSIGAINAACIVGASDRADARRRLTALWSDFIVETPSFLPSWVSRDYSLYSVPHFYAVRSDWLTMQGWTYVYDTHPLLQTLTNRVDFAALNASETAFVITAVDVESGVLRRFANRKVGELRPTRIEPSHVLASGSLPPQFPWTALDDGGPQHRYWDGGVVDNTPLGAAIDAFSTGAGVRRLLVVMNLFPATARLPRTMAEVNDRLDQLRFGNRLHQDSANADRINDLISTIDDLAKLVPGELPGRLAEKVAAARAYKLVEPVEISLVSDIVPAEEHGFRDFSRKGIEARRDAGREITLETLRPFIENEPEPFI